jgi:hypothetical protein
MKEFEVDPSLFRFSLHSLLLLILFLLFLLLLIQPLNVPPLHPTHFISPSPPPFLNLSSKRNKFYKQQGREMRERKMKKEKEKEDEDCDVREEKRRRRRRE